MPRTERQKAAAQENVKKAQAASLKSPKWKAAAQENVKKALAASLKSPKWKAASQENLKKGQAASLKSPKRKAVSQENVKKALAAYIVTAAVRRKAHAALLSVAARSELSQLITLGKKRLEERS